MTSVLDVSLKRTTVKQLQLMVKFLEGHKYLAGGKLRSKEQIALSDRLWSECASILNTEGDSRSPAEWKKYFNQYKSRLAAKMRRIKDVEDGKYSDNVEAPLTELEEKFAALCGFQTTSSAVPKLTLKINLLWFIQYKSRLLSQIRQQGTNEDSAPPLTALEYQFAAVCDLDPVIGCSTEREHLNGSIDSMSSEPSDCVSEQEMKYSDNEKSKSEPKHSVSKRLEVFGKIVELKLQELPENQRVIAEKIINETISMAEKGRLTMAHALNFAKSHKS